MVHDGFLLLLFFIEAMTIAGPFNPVPNHMLSTLLLQGIRDIYAGMYCILNDLYIAMEV